MSEEWDAFVLWHDIVFKVAFMAGDVIKVLASFLLDHRLEFKTMDVNRIASHHTFGS
jgi:hypothetical protein